MLAISFSLRRTSLEHNDRDQAKLYNVRSAQTALDATISSGFSTSGVVGQNPIASTMINGLSYSPLTKLTSNPTAISIYFTSSSSRDPASGTSPSRSDDGDV